MTKSKFWSGILAVGRPPDCIGSSCLSCAGPTVRAVDVGTVDGEYDEEDSDLVGANAASWDVICDESRRVSSTTSDCSVGLTSVVDVFAKRGATPLGRCLLESG